MSGCWFLTILTDVKTVQMLTALSNSRVIPSSIAITSAASDRKGKYQPPLIYAEFLCVKSGLNIEKTAYQYRQSEYHANEAGKVSRAYKHYYAEHNEKYAEGHIILEGEAVKVLWKITHKLYPAENYEQNSAYYPQGVDRKCRPCDKYYAEHRKKRRNGNITCFGDPHRSHRSCFEFTHIFMLPSRLHCHVPLCNKVPAERRQHFFKNYPGMSRLSTVTIICFLRFFKIVNNIDFVTFLCI